IEPFSIKGKTYSGLAKTSSRSTDNDVRGIDTMVITEVPKNTKIVMDKDTSNGKVIKYEDTESGKEKKEAEKRDFDNL
ncbi:hypothetical protein WL482_10925, partial [Staphylococcus hominis]